ncbi:hypothetical protein [Chryseobacterium vrystaatense]|uniref:Bacteriophage holin family protein n=1 Tax=Chryseobacterium vrystaatense TaxID=307480 RepID=A0A1M4ZLN1_9FLAO|nr:hypothetical protein [Chryseobacterium vrystaatense]SHF18953.1 hypothetical protein SAMN02787073_1637 [Chryseobacterium vrystaatense]
MKEFIIKNLLSIHSGGVGGKIWASVQLASVPAVGLSISERLTGWYIDSQFFIMLLIGGLLGDLILGVWKHLKLRTFSFKKLLLGFTEKMAIVTIAYFFTEAIMQIISDGDLDSVYFKMFSKIAIFLYPAGNAAVNMGIITNGKFPFPFLLKRIAKFNNSGDLGVFNMKKNQDEKDIDSNIPE